MACTARMAAGVPAHDPAMMVALLLYAYAVGERSSRQIERRCVEDVAFRVIAANRAPDHTTIARFRQRHAERLAELFVQVLAMCAKAGMVRVGTVAVDGTKLAANAGISANRTYEKIREEVERILAEADAVDAAEDERFGDARGDELPAELADPVTRRERLERAQRELEAEQAARVGEHQAMRGCPTFCVEAEATVVMSVGQSVSEVDLERGEAACPGADRAPFGLGALDREVDQLGGVL